MNPAPGAAPVTIVLADDHTIVRGALRRLLESVAGWEVVAEAGDAQDARRRVLGHRPAVLVLDLSMPGPPSLEEIPAIHRASPDTAIVVLTMQDDPRLAQEVLRAGAAAFVLKEAAESSLLAAIRAAIDGERYLDPRLGAAIAAGAGDGEPGTDALDETDAEIVAMVALGHTNAEIAGRLHLGVRTVEHHRALIARRLGSPSRAAFVAYASEHGLLTS